jgi:hypothetical protein
MFDPIVFPGFQKRRYCSTCGYPAGYHDPGQYGQNCTENCGYEECSKCRIRLEYHEKKNGRLLCDPLCPNEAHPQSVSHDWTNPSKRKNRKRTRYVASYSPSTISGMTMVCCSCVHSCKFSCRWTGWPLPRQENPPLMMEPHQRTWFIMKASNQYNQSLQLQWMTYRPIRTIWLRYSTRKLRDCGVFGSANHICAVQHLVQGFLFFV